MFFFAFLAIFCYDEDMKYMDYTEILKIIAEGGRNMKVVEIYYPKTDSNPAGWREIEPYSLSIDPAGEHLIYGEDRLSPGHIFNGYDIKSGKKHCSSFIIGKIKQARLTNKKFSPKWDIEF